LHDFNLQALFTEEPCLCRQVGYSMSYDAGCIADANFLLFRLCLSTRRTGDEQKAWYDFMKPLLLDRQSREIVNIRAQLTRLKGEPNISEDRRCLGNARSRQPTMC